MTTKHDRARVLHMYTDPNLQCTWTRTKLAMTREDLDAKGSSAEYEDPWSVLAMHFNDPLLFYQNSCVQYANGVRLSPYVAIPAMQGVAKLCYDLDPSLADRTIRDAAWMKNVWREMKSELSECWAKFTRSGQQDCEHKELEWIQFSGKYSNFVSYAICVLTTDHFKMLGKYLPPAMAKDSKVGGYESSSDNEDDSADGDLYASGKSKSLAKAAQRKRYGLYIVCCSCNNNVTSNCVCVVYFITVILLFVCIEMKEKRKKRKLQAQRSSEEDIALEKELLKLEQRKVHFDILLQHGDEETKERVLQKVKEEAGFL